MRHRSTNSRFRIDSAKRQEESERGMSAQVEEDTAMDVGWARFKPWEGVSKSEFADSNWQDRHAVTRVPQLRAALDGVIPAQLLEEIEAGLSKTGMSIRLNPYVISLIDWSKTETDPIRRQFLPMRCEQEADHPCLEIDLPSGGIHPSPALCTVTPIRFCFW